MDKSKGSPTFEYMCALPPLNNCQIEPEFEELDWAFNNLIDDTVDRLMFKAPDVTRSQTTFKAVMNEVNEQMSCAEQSTTINNEHNMNNVNSVVASGPQHENEDLPSKLKVVTDTYETQYHLSNANNLVITSPHKENGVEVDCVTHGDLESVEGKNLEYHSNTTSGTTKSHERNLGDENHLLPTKSLLETNHLNILAIFKNWFGNESCTMKLDGEKKQPCMGCKCGKSKCLNLHCRCFAAKGYCMESCLCRDCYNKPIYDDIIVEASNKILSRDPLAFAPKITSSFDSATEIGASARHKKGCKCKKSTCQKKYCECFQAGVGCSISCKCEGCKNAYGRKKEIKAMTKEENGACENSVAERKGKQVIEVQPIEGNANDMDILVNNLFSSTNVNSVHSLADELETIKGQDLARQWLENGFARSDPSQFDNQKFEESDDLGSQPEFEAPYNSSNVGNLA